QNAVGNLVEKPQYGGVLNFIDYQDPMYGFTLTGLLSGRPMWYIKMCNEPLLVKDRLKGPQGIGEWDGLSTLYPPQNWLTGCVAESWEIIQPDTILFHIRKGINWQDKAPTYGAELTAEDVVYSFVLYWSRKGSRFPRSYPYLSNVKNPEESIYLDPDDPWMVVFKSGPENLGLLWERVANNQYVIPKALGPMEGEGFVDWKGVVGTGALILTDYVAGSSLSFERNPNYWQNDPLHPENQLPYVDTVKVFIMPDASTQMAALRTGKIDILVDVPIEDGEQLVKNNPELQRVNTLGDSWALFMREDVAPFDNVKVRQAMMMAINHEELVEVYYGGNAVMHYYPSWPLAEHALMYIPYEELPEAVQELYEYHPDKAMQILDEAGLPGPDRFTTSVNVATDDQIDLCSIVKEYWERVGVTLEIRPMEDVAFERMKRAFTFEHGIINILTMQEPVRFTKAQKDSTSNYSRVNSSLIEETAKLSGELYFDWTALSAMIRERTPEINLEAHHVKLPQSYITNFWQPWVKSFHGEASPQYQTDVINVAEYVWLDQDLKEEMTGRR
ncbi:ABC transporter substrate-binding protein, partial [Chloroflexota bacterium]